MVQCSAVCNFSELLGSFRESPACENLHSAIRKQLPTPQEARDSSFFPFRTMVRSHACVTRCLRACADILRLGRIPWERVSVRAQRARAQSHFEGFRPLHSRLSNHPTTSTNHSTLLDSFTALGRSALWHVFWSENGLGQRDSLCQEPKSPRARHLCLSAARLRPQLYPLPRPPLPPLLRARTAGHGASGLAAAATAAAAASTAVVSSTALF